MMRFLIFLSIVYISDFYAQIPKNYFVDDANGVDFICFNFCVDENAKVTKAEFISEKSTYDNEHTINDFINYLLSIEFYPESLLKNDCHEIDFTLVNTKYQNSQFRIKEISNNLNLSKGLYQYKNPKYQQTKIKRKRRVQKEKGKEHKQIYKIKWLSNLRYNLVYKRMTEKKLKKNIGKSINVQILEVFQDGSYVYKATASHFKHTTYGMIKKLK